jgi:phage terminase small subunit
MSAYEDLTPKQRTFVDAYLASGNATDACLKAGYSPRRARQQGHDNVTNRYIQEALAERRTQLASTYDVTPEKVIAELALIGFSDLHAYVTWGPDGVTLRDSMQLDAAARRVVSEVSQTQTAEGGTIKFKLHNKVTALEKLGHHLGLFPDKLQIELLTKMQQLDAMSDTELQDFLAEVEAYGRRHG